MTASAHGVPLTAGIVDRAHELFRQRRTDVFQRIDQLFIVLMILQWIGATGAAIWIAPLTWIGTADWGQHVAGMIILSTVVAAFPISLAILHPGSQLTRHVIAACQLGMSALLIHATGGRVETHFHIFGSLALLTFYRDWRVLATATLVVIFDQYLRGVFWPASVFGAESVNSWRWLEHVAWVLIEVTFLASAAHHNEQEMQQDSVQRALLESTNAHIEREVASRTEDLERSRALLLESQRQLQRNIAQLESKNRDLDEFTYVASHDLQEPIRKLVSFSKLLRQDVGPDLPPQAEKDLQFIVEAAQRMRNLVQDLLALSRAGRSALKIQPVELGTCVQRACDALDVRVRESKASLEYGQLPAVMGDATVLTQLLQNLIGNALKFVPPDQTPRVVVTAERRGAEWIVTVADNGIGIKAEHFERIFAPFQRLHARAEYEGTGIGLAICKKHAERLGGRIWVESEVGVGTRFKFNLPATEFSGCRSISPATAGELSYC